MLQDEHPIFTEMIDLSDFLFPEHQFNIDSLLDSILDEPQLNPFDPIPFEPLLHPSQQQQNDYPARNFSISSPHLLQLAFPPREQPIHHPIKSRSKKRGLTSRKIKTQSECSICLLDMKKNSLVHDLDCKHEFHKKCLSSWMRKQETCPLCRLPIESPELETKSWKLE